MERSKFTKKIVLVATIVAGMGFLLSSLVGLWNLVQTPAPMRTSISSQNAQIETQANGYLEVLQKEPKNATAIQGLENVVRYYVQTGNKSKTIQYLEKLVVAAPEAKNVAEYKKSLAELKSPSSPAPKAAK
jgi:hypothetical protein